MGLVDYSDSEGSDAEAPAAPVTVATARPGNTKPAFQKAIDRSNPGKITVGLPTTKVGPGQKDGEVEEPPAKRHKPAGGGLGGFNDLLPAPKRAGQAKGNAAPKARGPGLKTSSEPAFGRAPMPEYEGPTESAALPFTNNAATTAQEEPVKLVGKSTASRFRPMSMTNNKKKPKKPVVPTHDSALKAKEAESKSAPEPLAEPAPKPKPKRSLFGAPQEESQLSKPSLPAQTTAYEPLLSESTPEPSSEDKDPYHTAPAPAPATAAPSLATTADDLHLTPSERRQLFGKNDPNASFNIQHFSTRDEYAANEKLRQQGEVTQHRAVKAVAPGKHSLQQLVNNAKTQQEGLEDAWAAGRGKRGEGAGRYGWG